MKRTVKRLLYVLLIASCARTNGPPGPEDPLRSADFYPLQLGATWSYQVVLGGVPQQGLLKIAVTDVEASAPDGEAPVYVVSVVDETLAPSDRVDEPMLYAQQPGEGIYCVKCEDYLLKEPLTVGQTWLGRSADGTEATYRVRAIAESRTINGIGYERCLVIEKTEPSLGRIIRTVYAPGVGPVHSQFSVAGGSEAGPPLREEILASFVKGS